MDIKEHRVMKKEQECSCEMEKDRKSSSKCSELFGGLASLALIFPFVGDYGFAAGAVADMIIFLPPLVLLVLLYRWCRKWLARRRPKSSSYVKTFEIEISERESTLAAMSIAQEKGRALSVEGGEDFEAMCVELAAENDLKLEDPKLQERVEEIRDSLPQKSDDFLKGSK